MLSCQWQKTSQLFCQGLFQFLFFFASCSEFRISNFFFSPGCCLFQLYVALEVRFFLVPLLSLQLQFLVFLDQYFLFQCRSLFHILFLNIFLVFFICVICLYSSFFHLLVYILLDNCFLARFFDILFLLLLAVFLNQLNFFLLPSAILKLSMFFSISLSINATCSSFICCADFVGLSFLFIFKIRQF